MCNYSKNFTFYQPLSQLKMWHLQTKGTIIIWLQAFMNSSKLNPREDCVKMSSITFSLCFIMYYDEDNIEG